MLQCLCAPKAVKPISQEGSSIGRPSTYWWCFVCQLYTNREWRRQGGWLAEAYNFISRPTHNEDACLFALAATAPLLATPTKCKQPSLSMYS